MTGARWLPFLGFVLSLSLSGQGHGSESDLSAQGKTQTEFLGVPFGASPDEVEGLSILQRSRDGRLVIGKSALGVRKLGAELIGRIEYHFIDGYLFKGVLVGADGASGEEFRSQTAERFEGAEQKKRLHVSWLNCDDRYPTPPRVEVTNLFFATLVDYWEFKKSQIDERKVEP